MQIHIDLSVKYNQGGDTAVGYVDDAKKPLSAIIIKEDIKKWLFKKYPQIKQDLNLFHAIILYILIMSKDRGITSAVICGEYNSVKVLDYLGRLIPSNIALVSIVDWRIQTQQPDIESLADFFVKKLSRTFKKRKNIYRVNKVFESENIEINVLSFEDIEKLIKEHFC